MDPLCAYSNLALFWLPLIRIENEQCYSQLSTHFERHVTLIKADESLVCSDKTLQFLQNLHYYVQN
jgi:hypothetical protein